MNTATRAESDPPPAPGSTTPARRRLKLAAAMALATALGVALVVLPIGRWLAAFLEHVQALGVWGPLAVAAAYIPAALLAIPGSILTLGAGLLFGVALGTVTVSIGSTLGALAAFLIARRTGGRALARRIEASPRFRALSRAIEGQGLRIVLLTRLSPAFPYNVLNYAYGLTPVRTRDYLLGTWLGMLPGTLMYVYLGSALTNLSQLAAGTAPDDTGSTARQIFFWGGLAATIAVTVLVTRIARRALRQAATSDDADPDPP